MRDVLLAALFFELGFIGWLSPVACGPYAYASTNQLKDLAASALTNKFVTLIGCGLCGFERQKPQPPVGVADSWDGVVTSILTFFPDR